MNIKIESRKHPSFAIFIHIVETLLTGKLKNAVIILYR